MQFMAEYKVDGGWCIGIMRDGELSKPAIFDSQQEALEFISLEQIKDAALGRTKKRWRCSENVWSTFYNNRV